jgi:Zn-dependent M28 family amino/carboxypeptidase
MILRVLGVIGTAVALIGLIALAAFSPVGHDGLAAALVLLLWLSATPLMLSIVGDKNHGTLDNASGVATVLEAVEAIPAVARVGVLITDAEELGLAGARAWVRAQPCAIALNCDSIDDGGRLTVMYSRAAPERLIAHLRTAATTIGEPLRVIRLIPGVLTDHVPFAAAGWETVTLSRGDLRTLARIHTGRDTLQSMHGTGIASAAQLLARTATELG